MEALYYVQFITQDVNSGETIEEDVQVGQYLGVRQPGQQPGGAQQQGENYHVPDVAFTKVGSVKNISQNNVLPSPPVIVNTVDDPKDQVEIDQRHQTCGHQDERHGLS